MQIREPRVCALYYYLGGTSEDGPIHPRERHDLFVADAQRLWQALAGWLALPAPALPDIAAWDAPPPTEPQLLMDTGALQGRTNAAGAISAYALRNMMVLRVVVGREGEHDQAVWAMLDEAATHVAAAPSWLHTTRYWCGIAPRPPEDLEQERMLPVHAGFGVLCLGEGVLPHVLVYPDARTEARAQTYLHTLAAQLDWAPVQARYRMGQYTDHASRAARNQQQALDRLAQAAHTWQTPNETGALGTIEPHAELSMLEATYAEALDDLNTTRAAAEDLRALVNTYRLTLLSSGLWDAAPRVCDALVARLAGLHAQVEADAHYVDHTLGRLDLALRALHTRQAIEHNAHVERALHLITYLIALIGLSIVALLVADTHPARIIVRLLALGVVAALVWAAWRFGPLRGASDRG